MTLLFSHSPDGEPQFGTIQRIVLVNSTVKRIVRKWETTGFARHVFAFTVCLTTENQAVDIGCICDYHPLHVVKSHKENNDNHYVSMRYRVF